MIEKSQAKELKGLMVLAFEVELMKTKLVSSGYSEDTFETLLKRAREMAQLSLNGEKNDR